jgi:hypothetical protein
LRLGRGQAGDAGNASPHAAHARLSDVPRGACAEQSAGIAEAPIAKLPFYPDWGRVLFPAKYEPKPPVAPPPPETASPPPPPAPAIATRPLREPQPVDPATVERASQGTDRRVDRKGEPE